jgi:poly-gamma-glutamate synthesis protein (capsule biosynthesis protein)
VTDSPAHQDTLTIAAIGDFMLERRPRPDDVRTVRDLLAGADLVIANVDTVLSDRGTPVPKWANLRGPRQAAHDLRAMGIDLVALANNHAMDFRAEGMIDMCRAFDEAGVRHAGAGPNLAAATAPAIVRVRDRTVAILSLACTLPPESAAGPDWPGVAPARVRCAFAVDESLLAEQPGTVPAVKTWLDGTDLARARRDVAAARAEADVVLAVVHWGVPTPWRAPGYPVLQEYQQPLGHALIDAGADAVLGNHAHELHGIEFSRDRPIAYCLGNFWIDTIARYPWMGHESLVFRLAFAGTAAPAVAIAPLYLDEGGVPRADPAARTVDVLARLSRDLGATVESTGERIVVRPTGRLGV